MTSCNCSSSIDNFSIGDKVICSASAASTDFIEILSPIPAPIFCLVIPSILIIPVPYSSGEPGQSFTCVFLLCINSKICPGFHLVSSIILGSTIALPLPTCCCGISTIFKIISLIFFLHKN